MSNAPMLLEVRRGKALVYTTVFDGNSTTKRIDVSARSVGAQILGHDWIEPIVVHADEPVTITIKPYPFERNAR